MFESEETTEQRTIAAIGLSMVPRINAQIVRKMREVGMSAYRFLTTDIMEISDRLGLTSKVRFPDSERLAALNKAKEEYVFVERHNIRVYSLLDDDYPWLLQEITDPPITLYQIGDANLNGDHILSLVGTRRCTMYGAEFCNSLVRDMGAYFPDTKIVSGLALGIDSYAHHAALEHRLSTIAVVAHGLDTLYPSQNRDLAKKILKNGGAILSEYPSKTTPFANRFLERNRIVAGLSHITVVAESEIKGGAMSTANFAFNYNREVGSLPGRSSDRASSGCNLLIRQQKANLISSAADILEVMNWNPLGKKDMTNQRNLFPELEGIPYLIYETLRFNAEPLNVDAIHHFTNVPISQLMPVLTELEFDGVISRIPGNRYTIT